MLAGSATRKRVKLLCGDGYSLVFHQAGIHDHLMGLVVTLSDTSHNVLPSDVTVIAILIPYLFDKDSGFEQSDAGFIVNIAVAKEHRRHLFALQVLGQEQHPARGSG